MSKGGITDPKWLATIGFLVLISVAGDVSGVAKAENEINIPDSTNIQILTLQDGSVLVGRTISTSDSGIVFQGDMGNMNIRYSRIKGIKEMPRTALKEGGYWFPNPNSTRLFFAPTARMLKKGQGYFCDYYLFFPGFSYGLTDYISIGGGLSLFPGLSLDKQAYYFTPKVSLTSTEKAGFALGALVISIPADIDHEDIPTFGIIYGVGTLGGPDGSFTAGLGYGFAGNDVGSKPALMIGGEKRVSRRISLLTENWVVPGVDNPLISYGARFFGENISVDLGFVTPTGEDFLFPGVPWVDFVFNFR